MATVLVTGANRGIGFELAKQLKERGDTVIATCRKSNDELNALGVQVEEGVDVGDDASVNALAERLGDTQLDLLINNAGVLSMDGLDEPDIEGIRRQIEINAIGPVRVTSAMLPRLGAGSKVAHITSRMGSIADNSSGGMYGYRMSKAALNMAGTSMARDLQKKRSPSPSCTPGMVATDMTSRFGHNDNFQQPDETASMLIERIDGLDMSNTGTFWHAKGEVLPW